MLLNSLRLLLRFIKNLLKFQVNAWLIRFLQGLCSVSQRLSTRLLPGLGVLDEFLVSPANPYRGLLMFARKERP